MILEQICKQVATRTKDRKTVCSEASLLHRLPISHKPHTVIPDLHSPGIHIFAEVKRASPSRGSINLLGDPVSMATSYLKHGAFAISVLTETDFFKGHPSFLSSIRANHPEARLFMKDFILDPYQLAEARILGADAVLLIVKALSDLQLRELINCAKEFALTPLVEVHDENELDIALACGAKLIGINNRNLNTFKIDLSVTTRLMRRLPSHAVAISESGIRSGRDIHSLEPTGVRGFLVGTTLMRHKDPGLGLAQLLKEVTSCK